VADPEADHNPSYKKYHRGGRVGCWPLEQAALRVHRRKDITQSGFLPVAPLPSPACLPPVLACGGTRLNTSNGALTSEVVWNELASQEGATGGGVSKIFPIPSYQASAGVPKQPETNFAGRGFPTSRALARPSGCSSTTAASPKSSTLTTPAGVIMMLAGFRSRWVMPFSCAASRASAIWRA
jgi:hypothetical protein